MDQTGAAHMQPSAGTVTARIAVTGAGPETFRSRLSLVGYGLCVLAGWMLRHPYLGVSLNDSTLYSLQALARLHPQSLPADIFLRFGSQDHYTVFSPLFAAAIRLLDLEPAAALLTATAQLAFFCCAWWFARRVMSVRLALLAIGLLIVLPGSYGVGNSFSYVESFLTPRQITEALVLACLASALARRRIMAGACLVAAMSLHPIMGFAGIVMLCCMYVAIPYPRVTFVTAVLLAVGTGVLALNVHSGPFAAFDPAWLKLIRDDTPYLFITEWSAETWNRIVVAVAGLGVGALTNTDPAVVRLCRAALLTALCSVFVTLIYCDLLHVVIFTQMQAWRWLWLVQASAVVLLPAIALGCWKSGVTGRATVVLLVSAWILRDYAVGAYVGVSAIAFAALLRQLTQPRAARLQLMGSYAMLLIAVTINLTGKLSDLAFDAGSRDLTALLLVRQWCEDGIFCAALLVMAWWMVERVESLARALFVATAGAIACLALAEPVKQSWMDFHYTRALQEKFGAWRATIPPHAEVLWPGTPLGSWYLLERPSYYSIHQVAGDIFSREKAMEIHRRAALVAAALSAGAPAQPTDHPPGRQKLVLPIGADKLNTPGLRVVCSDPALGFVVSWSHLGETPFAPIVPNPNKPTSPLYLYRCGDFRTAQSVAPEATVR